MVFKSSYYFLSNYSVKIYKNKIEKMKILDVLIASYHHHYKL